MNAYERECFPTVQIGRAMQRNRDFVLLKDDRWVVWHERNYYPIFLPGLPYESRPGTVSQLELEEIEFYEPKDSKSDKAIFIERSNSEVLVFFVPRNKKTGEKLHSNGRWFSVDTDEPIPLHQLK